MAVACRVSSTADMMEKAGTTRIPRISATKDPTMPVAAISPPINHRAWIDAHRHLLKPPVGSRAVWADRDLIVQVLAGPIHRQDYLVNPTEELYYQVEGEMTLRCIDAQGASR